MARATDLDGRGQPDADARNAVHKINIEVQRPEGAAGAGCLASGLGRSGDFSKI